MRGAWVNVVRPADDRVTVLSVARVPAALRRCGCRVGGGGTVAVGRFVLLGATDMPGLGVVSVDDG